MRAPVVRILAARCKRRVSRAACRRLQRSVGAWRTLRGSVRDPKPTSGLAGIRVTIVRKVGRRCRGRRVVAASCRRAYRRSVPARVSDAGWTLRLRGLRAGRYDVRVRASDKNGNAAIAKRTLRLR